MSMAAEPSPPPIRSSAFRSTARALLIEVAVLGALFFAYRWARVLTKGHIDSAVENAQSVWRLERVLALPSEAGMQQWVVDHVDLVKLANIYYVSAHFPVTLAMLVWLFAFHRQVYSRVRLEIVALTAMALVVHVLYPLAPPRLTPSLDMVDTMLLVGPSAYPESDTGIANQFAAMPSLHVGWAVLVAIAVGRVYRDWRAVVIWVHPIVTTFVVIVTANHYWLDGLVAIGLLLVAMWAVNWWVRRGERPEQLADGRLS